MVSCRRQWTYGSTWACDSVRDQTCHPISLFKTPTNQSTTFNYIKTDKKKHQTVTQWHCFLKLPPSAAFSEIDKKKAFAHETIFSHVLKQFFGR